MSYDSDVVSATSGRGEPDWDKIIKLCNRIRDSIGTLSMAQAMGSVMRRVKHSDSNIQLHALTLLESCVSNCGPDFQLELTKSTFHSDVKSILTGPYTDQRVKQRVKELLGSWATEFKSNSRMSPLIKFVEQLGREGVPPQPSPGANRQQPPPQQTPPAAIREDADLKKAIQLSLLETKATPPTSNLSLYPSVGSTPVPILKKKAARKVRAVYDFVAAEDNELSFRAGEVITIIDESDENWWKGETQLGKGLFPASFVSANLSVELQPSNIVENRKENQSSGGQKKKSKKADKVAVVNEQKIDLFLDMIKGADVTSEENRAENETLLELEGECKKMKPLVDEKIAALQIQEDEMQEINKNFEEALVLYRK
ncbi:signal transducing adapter molecule 1-like isoform X2 [Halichondria panicea]